MATYKVVDADQLDADMSGVAASIRAKGGTTEQLAWPDGYKAAIAAIQGEGGGYGDVPTYHYVETLRVAENISTFKKAHPNHLIFGAVSDIHVYNANSTYEAKSKTSIKHAAFGLEMVGAMAGCDFIANLGDNCWENGIDTDNALVGAEYSMNALKAGRDRLKTYSLVGNHDTSNSTQKMYDLIGKHNTFDVRSTTQIRCFGYDDYEDKKVRVIVLNTGDYWNIKGGCALSYEQKDFLLRALDLSAKSDAADWGIILLSHIPLDWNGGDYNFYADLQAILNAYEDGTTASITVSSSYARGETPGNYATYSGGKLVYNYSGKNAAKIIANIHGHVHTNKVGKLANTNIARVATVNVNPDLNKSESYPEYGDYSITSAEAVKIAKVSGTAKDTAATFYCIDLDAQIIYAFGYGADIDRTIVYKDATVYAIAYNLTGVTSNNTTTAIIEGEAFTATLSANAGYALDTVTVKMGGVDITATAYSNGVIAIAKVTGNIVITATAKDNYVPHWDIADRTAVTDVYETKEKAHACITSRHNYIYGIASTGDIDYRKISDVALNGNDITFKSTAQNYNIGLPYQLEPGASYTFKATASQSARLRVCTFDTNGLYAGDSTYSNSGTDLTHIFTANANEGYWTVLMLDVRTANNTTTFSNISLTKN